MLKLKAVKFEALTSLLYVVDQYDNVYVLVDRGRQFDFISKPRYRLHTLSPTSGEIRHLVDKPWELVKGVDVYLGKFPSGLCSEPDESQPTKKKGVLFQVSRD